MGYSILFAMAHSKRFLIAACTLFGIVAAITLGSIPRVQSASDTLQISFLDIGQGDSIFIQAPNGSQILIDGGRDQTVLTKLAEVMPRRDRSINYVIATHPDADHIGGLPSVFEQYEIGGLLTPNVSSENNLDEALVAAAYDEGIPVARPKQGMRLILDSEKQITLDILAPDHGGTGIKETNEASIVTRLTYGTVSVLLTGDAPMSVEQYLVDAYGSVGLSADILKLGHHGSKTSSSSLFLRAAAPLFAVVSAGKDNSYGHPNAGPVALAKSLDAEVLNTADEGTITFITDGARLWRAPSRASVKSTNTRFGPN
jgi:competence protein ComEC